MAASQNRNRKPYDEKKHKSKAIVMELGLALMHVFIIIALVGNIYSAVPRYHFVNDNEIVIRSAGDRILISEFRIDVTEGGERYIVLYSDNMRISSMSGENFTLSTERLFIRGGVAID